MNNTIKITIAVLSISSAFAAPAMASDEKGMYQTMHFIPCEAYAKDRQQPKNTGMNAVDTIYVSGWLSGYNYVLPNTYDIVPTHNVNAVMKWLDNYCKENPKKNVEAGLIKLTDDLYPKRIQKFVAPAKDGAADKKK